jgi:hypothetical protein
MQSAIQTVAAAAVLTRLSLRLADCREFAHRQAAVLAFIAEVVLPSPASKAFTATWALQKAGPDREDNGSEEIGLQKGRSHRLQGHLQGHIRQAQNRYPDAKPTQSADEYVLPPPFVIANALPVI